MIITNRCATVAFIRLQRHLLNKLQQLTAQNMSSDAVDLLSLVHIHLRRALGAGPMNGESSAVFAGQPLLPALGLACALIVVLSLALVFWRHQGSKSRGARVPSLFKKAEQAATEEDERPRVLILFGTQTGTAERFSKQLKSELSARYGDGNRYDVLDMEEYKPENLEKEKMVFLMMATYGDGEPTDNAADFYSWLTKTASEADKGIGSASLLEVLQLPVQLSFYMSTRTDEA